jgi:hypothetical protein
MDKMREEFESWYNEKFNNNDGVAYYVDITGRYCFPDIQRLFEVWQASRAAIKVELPEVSELNVRQYEPYTGNEYHYDEDVYFVQDIKDMLRDAGITYE